MDQQDLSIFSPASPPAESIRTLSVLVFAITGLIFFVVEGVLIYLIVRSRRRDVDDTKEPPQLYGSRPIEIAWDGRPGPDRLHPHPGDGPDALGGPGPSRRSLARAPRPSS